VPCYVESRRRWVRRFSKTLFKATLTLILLWWVTKSLEIGQLRTTLGTVSVEAVALAGGAIVLQTAIIGWRWHRIVHLLGGVLPPGNAIYLAFVGLFFNQALPTSVGGDAVRIWRLHRLGSAPGLAFSSVAIERMTGVVVLGLMITLCLPAVWHEIGYVTLRTALLAVGPSLLACLLLLTVVDKLTLTGLPPRYAELVSALPRGLRLLGARRRTILEVTGLGIAASLTGILAAYILGRDLAIPLSLPAYVTLVGGAALFSVLPFSIGGWGLREASMVALFGAVGVSSERALVLSILWGVLPLVVSLPVGVAWWAAGESRREGSDPSYPSGPRSS
jgi:hypothetical protein